MKAFLFGIGVEVGLGVLAAARKTVRRAPVQFRTSRVVRLHQQLEAGHLAEANRSSEPAA